MTEIHLPSSQRSSSVQEKMRNHRKHTDLFHKPNHVHEIGSNRYPQKIQFSKFSMPTCKSMVIQSPWSVKCRFHKFQYPKQASLHSIACFSSYFPCTIPLQMHSFMQMRFPVTTFPISSWTMSMKLLSLTSKPSLCRIYTVIARAKEYTHSCQSNPIHPRRNLHGDQSYHDHHSTANIQADAKISNQVKVPSQCSEKVTSLSKQSFRSCPFQVCAYGKSEN